MEPGVSPFRMMPIGILKQVTTDRARQGSRQAVRMRQDGGRQDPTVDLASLADLIEDLTRRNADLSATAAMWQTRAAHLEDQLKQLTAGGDNHHEAVESPESGASPEHGSTVEGDADRGSESVWDRIRGWFR